MADSLCKPPPEPPAGCCAAPPPPLAAPVVPINPPGLAAIAYRIGTFTSFRRAMLDDVARPDLLPGIANPFAHWHEGTDGDYQTMFVELWAYLADILTFYQERIANEAYLPTATQRDSLARLAALIGYRPSPGSAAGGMVSFTVETNKTVTVPQSFRTGSKAQPEKPAAVFEIEAALIALGEHSAIPLSPVAPTNQFAQLSYVGLFFGTLALDPVVAGVAAADLYGNAGATYLSTFATSTASVQAASQSFVAQALRPSLAISSSLVSSSVVDADVELVAIPRFVSTTTRSIVLKGVNLRLASGDYVLAVENEGASGEQTNFYQITQLSTDKTADTTTITWEEPEGTTYDRTSGDVAVYALRVEAGAFGNTAPLWSTLPATLNGTVNKLDGPFKDKNWDDMTSAGNGWGYLPTPGDPEDRIFLDGVYDQAKGTPTTPDRAVLLGDGDVQVLHVTDARPVSRSAYAVTQKATRLTFLEEVNANLFPVRTTVILTGAEPLPLQNNLPLPDPVAGDKLILSGVHTKLQAGQTVILQGTLYNETASNAEVRTLKSAPLPDLENNITTVTLSTPLDRQYTRASSVLLANVVEVTQGETVRDEVLGSGNGGAFQSYKLKKSPLTYLPSTDPEGLSAVASTLTVTVNGTLWEELDTLVESAPDTQAYATSQDESGQTTIQFGDGFQGARPPTGRDNIRARYRKGLGVSGNVEAAGIQQLIDSVPGLQKVTNPLPSSGGADAESIANIRTNAPASVRAFSRAVSAPDYAALALSFPGVVKASAAWVMRDEELRAIAYPYVQLTVITQDEVPLAEQPVFAAKLRSYLDQRRDPNVPLRILDFIPVYVDIAVTVDIDDRFPREGTVANVRATLTDYFALANVEFGESIHLSALYAVLLGVDGVTSAYITRLRRMDTDAADPAKVRDHIFIRPVEIAVIGGDPADPPKGLLEVNPGLGGFADT